MEGNMGNVSLMQIIGMIVTVLVFAGIGVYSGRKIKTKSDYYVAGQSFSATSVAGTTAGQYIGGGCVIGTAQLAFTDGFSGLYFTIGAALAIIIMGVGFSTRIRGGGKQTIQEMIESEYGQTACLISTLLGILAFYINNISHFLSGISLVSAIFPFSTLTCTIIIAFLILACVYMGGFWGLSLINVLKTFILLACVIISTIAIFAVTNGFSDIAAALPERYFYAAPRGMGEDFGNLFSTILGLLSTQSTIQAVFSARSDRDCKIGFTLGALVLPVVGVCCTFIGMYMRMIAPEMNSIHAFPQFILMHTNGFIGGVILATTFVAVATAGVSVMLGIAGILLNNIYMKRYPDSDTKSQLRFSRTIIALMLIFSSIVINSGVSDMIMQYNVLSMSLRGAVLFLPMCAALFLPGKISPRFAIASMIAGPIAMLLGKYVLPIPFDFIYFGMLICIVIMALGAVDQRLSHKKAV